MSSDRTYFHSVAPAKPRTGETLEGAVAYARGYSGGGGGSGGNIDPGSVGSNLSIVAGDRILVEETQGVIRTMVKISHAVPKEEDIDSQTTAEEADFVKNLHLDKQGHVVKAEVQSVGQLFDKRYLRKDQPDETNFRVTFRDGADFGDFVEGFLGSGGRIDRNGHCWLGGMHLREFLEVPELRFGPHRRGQWRAVECSSLRPDRKCGHSCTHRHVEARGRRTLRPPRERSLPRHLP